MSVIVFWPVAKFLVKINNNSNHIHKYNKNTSYGPLNHINKSHTNNKIHTKHQTLTTITKPKQPQTTCLGQKRHTITPPHKSNRFAHSRPTHKNTRLSRNINKPNNNTSYKTQLHTNKLHAKSYTKNVYCQHQTDTNKIKKPRSTDHTQKEHAITPPHKNRNIHTPSKKRTKHTRKHNKTQHQNHITHKSPKTPQKTTNKNTLLTKTTPPTYQTT